MLAAEVALQRGLACSTAGGTHHAFPSYGSGFCLLNDLAVAAKHVTSTSSRKVLIVDLDVHQVAGTSSYCVANSILQTPVWYQYQYRVCVSQGDGTAFIFKEEPCVFTFSVHCGKNFPLRKQQSDLDVSLDDELEDKEYLSTGTLTHNDETKVSTFRRFTNQFVDCPTVETHLPGLLDAFRPDLVLYDAGVDPHWEDELGRLRLTDQGK